MINITLDSHFKLQSDKHQWILTEDDRMIEFWNDLEGLIQSYFKRKLRTSDAKTIEHLMEVHKQCLNSLQKALAPLQIEVYGYNSEVRPGKIKLQDKQGLGEKGGVS
jgi:hypothetical protein